MAVVPMTQYAGIRDVLNLYLKQVCLLTLWKKGLRPGGLNNLIATPEDQYKICIRQATLTTLFQRKE